ncbi:MAG: hypothetical protein IPM55_02445 [Acidobacteria bacterium]|nr:hypothetical protein [Acidobacteriota bacterium]
MKRTERTIDIPDLIRRMIEAGASFHRSAGGTWRVDNLASLPCDLRDEFYQADETAIAAQLRLMAARVEGDQAA